MVGSAPPSRDRIRVLVVDDSVVVRRLVVNVLEADEAIDVIGTAANGRLALEQVAALEPDVVTMDIEMPEMDGLAALRELRKTQRRLPIIMFSTLTERGAKATLEALASGASDFVTKPANVGGITAGMEAIRAELIPKIKALAPRSPRFTPPVLRPAAAPTTRPVTGMGGAGSMGGGTTPLRRHLGPAPRVRVVAIGVSTGGPTALAEIWPRLIRPPVPIVIVQHMPPVFTEMLARRLDDIGTVPVMEAADRTALEPGRAYIAPGDHHLVIEPFEGFGRLRTNQDAPVNSCRPAVDPLFESAVDTFGSGVLGVVLTGMGTDGTVGGRRIVEAGGRVVAQDEASSVVWGMPGSVVHAGLVETILPLGSVAEEINRRVLSPGSVTRKPSPGAVLPCR